VTILRKINISLLGKINFKNKARFNHIDYKFGKQNVFSDE